MISFKSIDNVKNPINTLMIPDYNPLGFSETAETPTPLSKSI